MSESVLKMKRKTRFFLHHPKCCFCGGGEDAATWDHIPPRACFPRGYHPENFEFPACKSCNESTKEADQIFALYTVLVDFCAENYDAPLLKKLIDGVRNNQPWALPNLNLPSNVKRSHLRDWGLRKPAGMLLSDVPLAGVPVDFNDIAVMLARKITCAMYYRHAQKILPVGYQIANGWFQIQDRNTVKFMDFLNEILARFEQPTRSNIKKYGKRLSYKFNYNEFEDFFGLAMQFGDGLLIWGISARPEIDMNGFENLSPWAVQPPVRSSIL